jgi:hypothetical protein
VSWQPPVTHVQQRAHPHPALGLTAAAYSQPTTDIPAITQYSSSANFPPEDTIPVHTHASYSNQRFSKLISDNCGNWTLALDVPIPKDMVDPTLTSLSYTTKYSTANDQLPCMVRSNILLAASESEEPEHSVITDPNTDHHNINVVPQTTEHSVITDPNTDHHDINVVPQTSKGATVMLSSVLGIKANDLGNQWNHFVDRQHIPFNIRIVQSSRLYLQVHISEYPTEDMLRSLLMDVSATWLDDQELRRQLQKRQEAETRANDMEAKVVVEEEARKKAETQQAADEQARDEAEANRRAVSHLPKDRECGGGFAWVQTATGFKCTGGGHSISKPSYSLLRDRAAHPLKDAHMTSDNLGDASRVRATFSPHAT